MIEQSRRMRLRPTWWFALGRAAVLLSLVRTVLGLRGYRRTMRLLQDRRHAPLAAGKAGDSVPDAVAEIASAVMTIAKFDPFRSRCLARSITIWWMARRRGHDVDLMMGVAKPAGEQVSAHAWVEYVGTPLNDTADVRSRYVVLPMPRA